MRNSILMRNLIVPPVLAIAVVACMACLESSVPSTFYWSMIAASLGTIITWKLAVGATICQMKTFSFGVDQENMTALKPIAIAYLAFLPLMSLALSAIWYFDLGLSIFLLFIGIWSIRKEVYALSLSHRLGHLSGSKSTP
jgi:hypothetical protein